MKTRFFTAIVLTALLLTGDAAFANGGGDKQKELAKGGRHGERTVAVHASRGRSSAQRGRGKTFATSRGGKMRGSKGNVLASSTRAPRSRPSVAFGGSSYNYAARGNGRDKGGNNTYGSGYAGKEGRDHGWRDHGNDWASPYFGVYPYIGNAYPEYRSDSYGPFYGAGNSMTAQVQQDLAQQGYYKGPIDGVNGPATQAAIVGYQQDNGLPPTGTINAGLLQSLGI